MSTEPAFALPFSVPDSPRTLADINPDASIGVNWAGVRDVDRELAGDAMRVIALWAWVDVSLTGLMAAFMHTNLGLVTDMLAALRSARMTAIRAAAEAALGPQDRKLFNRGLDEMQKACTWTRDMYAHFLWVTSPEAPGDVLLVVSASAMAKAGASIAEILATLREHMGPGAHTLSEAAKHWPVVSATVPPPQPVEPKDVKIITANDLQNDLHIADIALALANDLRRGMLPDAPGHHQSRTQLPNRIAYLRDLRILTQRRRQ